MAAEQDWTTEELRLAVVMNGGVSLAIWIGGVTHEINELVQAKPGSTYDTLLRATRTTPRVDVIAGTSAGGINGAFLALANVYRRPLTILGDLWAKKGGFLELFRPAMEGDPPSLMRGDEYFLPSLREAFDQVAPVATRGDAQPVQDVPIHLIMTTTLMRGTLRRFADDFGNNVLEVEHKGRFVFRRGSQTDPRTDPFAKDDIAQRLALAARSTASFPIAFEPSYVPVAAAGPDDLHPDMDPQVEFPRSRWVLDGGVLMNKPVAPALAAINAQRGEGQVRRVLAYVVPDPGTPEEAQADDLARRPGAGKVLLDSLVTLPRAQSIADDLAELRETNRRVRTVQALRPEVTPRLGPELEELAPRLFDTYRLIRARRAVANVADIVTAHTMPPPDVSAPAGWTLDELLVAFGCDGPALAGAPVLPFVPAEFRVSDRGDAPWDWGLAPAERLARVALDVFRRAILVAPWDDADLRRTLGEAKGRVHDRYVTLLSSRAGDDRFWSEQATLLGAPPADTALRADTIKAWAADAVSRWPAVSNDPPPARDLMLRALELTTIGIVEELVNAAPALRDAVTTGLQGPNAREAERLADLLDGLAISPGRPARRRRAARAYDATVTAVLTRVFAGEVALLAFCVPAGGVEQAVELVQVSGDTPNAFGGPSRVDKLAGVSMGHFGAFYKRSWRVSDWIWGRVDGAVRLCQVVLSPARLRQLGETTETLLPLLREAAVGTGDDARELAAMWENDVSRVVQELRFLDEPDLPLPPSLPFTATVVARRVHVEVLAKELGNLAAAARFDAGRGGAPSNGMAFAHRYEAATSGGSRPSAGMALDLFANADIAGEMGDEVGSDLMAVTAGRALAVGVAAADAKGNGLGPVRLIARSLRGVTLTAYGLVYASTRRSKFGTAVSLAVLAVAGALLALSLMADVPGPLKVAATVLVLGALVEAVLRSKMWELAFAIAVPATAALAVLLTREDLGKIRENVGPIAGVVGAVVGLMAFGSVRRPSGLPFLARWKHRRVVGIAGIALSVAALWWMSSVAHGNIVELQLRGWTRGMAGGYLDAWKHLDVADDYVGRDFAFLAVYWIWPMVLVGWAADRLTARGRLAWARRGRTLAWLPVYVAVFDAVENVFQLREISEAQRLGPLGYGATGTPYLAPLATVFAWWKWLLLLAVLAYVVGALVTRARRTGSGGG
jgi:patatin-related protein